MKGWIFDLYPGKSGEMVVWLKEGDGRTDRLVDGWVPSFYVACDSREDLRELLKAEWLRAEAEQMEIVNRYERITDKEMSEVLQVRVGEAKAVPRVAAKVERSKPFGHFRIYNADVPPEQSYLYERLGYDFHCDSGDLFNSHGYVAHLVTSAFTKMIPWMVR